jgi:hypothetical protein
MIIGKYYLIVIACIALVLGACSGTVAPAQSSGQLAVVDHAIVEVGLGSPTPVIVTIDANYSSICSQISEINQTFDGSKFTIEVRVADAAEACAQESLPFRIVLQLNGVGLPKGNYTVEANGVDAGSFEFQN